MGLQIGIILAQILDFFDKVVLMCLGMWFVDTYEFACSTSTANLRSDPVTLHKKKQAGGLASARTKVYVCDAL